MLGERQKQIRVAEVMIRDPITLAPDASTLEAIDVMRHNGISCLPVVKDDHLVEPVPMAATAWHGSPIESPRWFVTGAIASRGSRQPTLGGRSQRKSASPWPLAYHAAYEGSGLSIPKAARQGSASVYQLDRIGAALAGLLLVGFRLAHDRLLDQTGVGADLPFDFVGDLGMVLQELLGVLPALADPLA